MSDFDDLLSSHHKSTAAPVFDNPFQDVFDGVSGRPRSPDPWSTGGWGEPDLPPVTSYNAAPPQPASPPLSPGGFKEYQPPSQSYYQDYEVHHHQEFEARAQTPPLPHPPAHEEEPPKPVAPPIDPLGGTLQDEDEVPVKRNPLGPLPPAPKLPDLPPPAVEKPPPAAESTPTATEKKEEPATEPASQAAAPVFDDSDAQHVTSPSQSVATVKDDDDDDKPLIPPPVFVITVGDPQKVGDPLSAHIVYTVQTRTTSPAFSKSSFSVLRRYSDFLWLYETLSANNPGVIVPPVPEKNPFNISRFESEFVETRRLGLNKCVQKIANHPVLNKDQDFKFFLESDSFALDIKHRRQEGSSGGLLASFGSLTAPKFYEIDDWFDNKRAYLDALESQLKGLVKAMDIVSKQRNEFAVAISEFADTIAALSLSDLSKQLTQSLSSLAEVERLYKDMQETQGKDDIITIMGTADEYGRLINSVRLAFNSRIKLYFAWQSADTEARRIKSAQEKARRQGRTTGSMVEIAEAERRAQEAKREFDDVSKLIKMELGRFEKERIEDFKVSMEDFLESMIRKQKALIQAWESYQSVLLKRAATNPTSEPVPEAEEAEAI
ncbi:Vacuolar protein sorting-associated protein 5 [Tulasnella sp. UAMH 9824]|nr:Vacuolar protein sorting-associated protein 5 [Tulasnella sp. UAMH 9824]